MDRNDDDTDEIAPDTARWLELVSLAQIARDPRRRPEEREGALLYYRHLCGQRTEGQTHPYVR